MMQMPYYHYHVNGFDFGRKWSGFREEKEKRLLRNGIAIIWAEASKNTDQEQSKKRRLNEEDDPRQPRRYRCKTLLKNRGLRDTFL